MDVRAEKKLADGGGKFVPVDPSPRQRLMLTYSILHVPTLPLNSYDIKSDSPSSSTGCFKPPISSCAPTYHDN